MKKGERAILTCQAPYAYGQRGSPPKIPPNATLKFEVELISWESAGVLTPDGGIVRKTLQRGTGAKAAKGHEVTVHYVGKLADGKIFDSSRERDQKLTFTIGKGTMMVLLQICSSLSQFFLSFLFPFSFHFFLSFFSSFLPFLADTSLPAFFHKTVENMSVGDIFRVTVKPKYAFGEAGDAKLGVPPNATVVYDIELLLSVTIEQLREGVTKKTLKKGSDFQHPKDGAKVEVKLTGRVEGKDPFLTIAEATHFTLGAGQLPEAVEIGLLSSIKYFFSLLPFFSLTLFFSSSSFFFSLAQDCKWRDCSCLCAGLRPPVFCRGEPEEGHSHWSSLLCI